MTDTEYLKVLQGGIPIVKHPHFRPWVHKVMPGVYDDTLSYYELLAKVVGYINQMNDQQNEIISWIEETVEYQNGLIDHLRKEWKMFEKYFVDVLLGKKVSEILNEWFENGKLAEIINEEVFGMKADKTYVKERFDDIGLNVKDFGAKEDGVTDDSIAIQRAINKAYENGGGRVLLNAKTYVASVDIKKGVTLEGVAKDKTTIKLPDGTSGRACINATDVDSVKWTVKSLTIDGNKANNVASSSNVQGTGIYISRSSTGDYYDTYALIRDVDIKSCVKHGLMVQANSREIRYENVTSHDNGFHGFYILSSDSFYVDCTAYGNQMVGIYVRSGANHLTNTKAFGNGRNNDASGKFANVMVEGATNCVFSNITTQEAWGHGIYVKDARDMSFMGVLGSSNGITSNDQTKPSESFIYAGMFLQNAQGITVTGVFDDFRRFVNNAKTQKYGLMITQSERINATITAHSIDPEFQLFVDVGEAGDTPDTQKSYNLVLNGDNIYKKKKIPLYNDGKFTPRLNNDELTYSTQFGRWTRTGNTVRLDFRVDITSIPEGLEGEVQIVDLPFNVTKEKDELSMGNVMVTFMSITDTPINIMPYTIYGTDAIRIAIANKAGAFSLLDYKNLTKDSAIWGSISYRVE